MYKFFERIQLLIQIFISQILSDIPKLGSWQSERERDIDSEKLWTKMGKVKQRGKMGEKGDSGGGIVGKSEGGWVLCKDGKYRVDPKWVGGSQCVQPSLDILPTPVIAVAKTDILDVKAASALTKVKNVKSKVKKVSSGSSKVCEKEAISRSSQVGGLARTRAKMENDGYGLFPVDFNTEYRTSGDSTFQAATEKLQQLDNNTFKLHKTKTYEFLRPDSVVVTWEALQLAKTRSSSSSQGDSKTPIQVSLKDGKTGSILPDAPVPQYNSKMSKARKEELKCQKVAFNDKATYLKSWPEKQPRTGKSKCGFWGRRGSKREKAKQEVASKKEVKSAKREVWWEEGWRKRKEEKVRLAEEEKARERKMHLRLVSPLDLDAQVLMMILMIVMDMTMMMMITILK